MRGETLEDRALKLAVRLSGTPARVIHRDLVAYALNALREVLEDRAMTTRSLLEEYELRHAFEAGAAWAIRQFHVEPAATAYRKPDVADVFEHYMRTLRPAMAPGQRQEMTTPVRGGDEDPP